MENSILYAKIAVSKRPFIFIVAVMLQILKYNI